MPNQRESYIDGLKEEYAEYVKKCNSRGAKKIFKDWAVVDDKKAFRDWVFEKFTDIMIRLDDLELEIESGRN